MGISHRAVLLLLGTGLIVSAISCRHHSSQSPALQNPTQTAAQYLAQADQLYTHRDDLQQLREAIIALHQAHIVEPDNYDAAWRLAKFDYYLGSHTDNSDERDQVFRDGIDAGKTAVQLEENKPDGHFWLGAIYGGVAQSSILAGLTSIEDIRKEMNRVIQLDEGYQNGSAYMVLGLVYLQSPQLLGGDPQKAVAEMEKGLRFGSDNAFLRLHLAEAYVKAGRQAEARQQLEAIIAMTPDQNYLPEYKEALAQAHKLQDQIH